MFGWAEVSQQSGHFVKGSTTDGFVVATRRQVVADLLLVVPQQSVQRQDVGIADERHRVATALLGRFKVRCDLDEEPTTRLKVRPVCSNHKSSNSKFPSNRLASVSSPEQIVEVEHVLFFGEFDVVGNVLQNLRHEHQPSLDVVRRLPVQNPHFVRRH